MHGNLFQQIRSNQHRTVAIMLGFFIIVMSFSLGIGYFYCAGEYDPADGGYLVSESAYHAQMFSTLSKVFIWTAVIVGGYIWLMMHQSINIVASMNHAKEVTNSHRFPVFKDLVSQLCVASGLPENRIRLFVIDDASPNACSVGTLHRKNGTFVGDAGVGVTTGMLKIANQYELMGVLGHEMSHLIDQDTRLATVGIALTSLFSLIGGACLRLAWYSSWFDSDDYDYDSNDSDDNDSGGITAILLVVGIVGWLFAGISYLTQLCLDRNREYLADAGSVNLTRNPAPLISIFAKLKNLELHGSTTVNSLKYTNATSSALFMFSPNHHASLFDTHPSLDDRIQRLREMGGGPVQNQRQVNSGLKYCLRCHRQIPKVAEYCPYCGARQSR